MQNSSYIEQFLYLIVYSVSIINAAAVIVLKKRLTEVSDKLIRRAALLTAAFSTLISLQTFLNALGILEHITETNAAQITITFNVLLIACFAALAYTAGLFSFKLRPARFSRQLRYIALIVIVFLLFNVLLLQILSFFSDFLPAAALLGMLMLYSIIMFAAAAAFSAIRLYIPLHTAGDNRVLKPVRIFILCLFLFPGVFILSGSIVGSLLAPAGYILLNILILRILYVRLHSDNAPDETGSAEADPAETCRELGLSRRESEVALLLAKGKSYKEIAAELFISMSTTQTHVGRIYSKLGINNKTELSGLLYYKK